MELPSLERLTLCRGLLDRPALWALQECLKAPSERAASLLAASLLEEAENSCLRGNLLSSFIVHFLWEGDNPAAEAVQRSGSWGRGLERALCGDMEVLLPYLKILPSAVSGLSWLDDYEPSAESPCRGEADLKQALCSCSDPKQAALILLVADPTPFGFHDFRLAHQAFLPLNKAMAVVINRAGAEGNADGDAAVRDYCREHGLPLLAELPFERAAAEQYANGRLLAALSPEWKQRFEHLRDALRRLGGEVCHA